MLVALPVEILVLVLEALPIGDDSIVNVARVCQTLQRSVVVLLGSERFWRQVLSGPEAFIRSRDVIQCGTCGCIKFADIPAVRVGPRTAALIQSRLSTGSVEIERRGEQSRSAEGLTWYFWYEVARSKEITDTCNWCEKHPEIVAEWQKSRRRGRRRRWTYRRYRLLQ